MLAHHFTEAGLTEAAIEYWGKAGDQALRRSAFPEAISHLGKAIEMADKGGGQAPKSVEKAPAPTDQRLKLQTSYGQAMTWSKGFAAEETKAALAQTERLAAFSHNVAERMKAHYARWVALFTGGELESAHAAAEGFLREAKLAGDPMPCFPKSVLNVTVNRVVVTNRTRDPLSLAANEVLSPATSCGNMMNAEGVSETTLVTIIHTSPIILRGVFPNGTGLSFDNDLTCTPLKCAASGEYAMMSIPRALLVVGMTFQPRRDRR